jgi:hypothetical protein
MWDGLWDGAAVELVLGLVTLDWHVASHVGGQDFVRIGVIDSVRAN